MFMDKMNRIGDILYKLIGTVVLLAAFFWIVHPLLTHFVIPPLSVHKGADCYTSGRFAKFEDGELFEEFIRSWEIPDRAEAVDFYHVNHWVRDNPLYGKFCDVFAVDIRMEPEDYAQMKTAMSENTNYGQSTQMGIYTLWQWSVDDIPDTYGVAFCDRDQIVRFFLVTELHESQVLPTVFEMNTSLDWGY